MPGELEVGANYVWCLVIVDIFIGFGGAKRLGELTVTIAEEAGKPHRGGGGAVEGGGESLWGKVVTTRHYGLSSLPELISLLSITS